VAVLEASSLRQAAVEEADTEVTVIAAVDLAAAWQRDPLSPIAAAVAAAEILIRAERETKPRASLRSGRQELIVVDEVEAAQAAAVVAGVALKTATPLTSEMLASEMELLAAASWAAVVAVAAGIAAAEEGADLLTFVSDEVVGLQSAPAAAEQELPRWNKSRIHRTDLMEGRMMP
jgi:hypothetical protein